ncbi:MAG: UDP-N-acetylmuramyl pentapeptide phosphotransferase [Desulfobacterales bacterium]|nr:UDP-N-acetylmuramyl pentapeptide phosphotransferase [Desulfobacterales bacterium]
MIQSDIYRMCNSFLFIAILSFSFASAGAWLIGRYGYMLGLMDNPNKRSSHNISTPKGGGIGILFAFVFCSIFQGISYSFWISASILSIISFIGDRYDISPKIRLIIQFIISSIFIYSIVLYHPGLSINFVILFIPLVIYIIGTANYYNFMDGINGLAAITGFLAFLFLAIYAYHIEFIDISILSISISSACLGFLPFNFPKARVFMGDAGSIFLGLLFAGIVILLSSSLSDFICLSAFLFPFYADEFFTLIVRIKDGDSIVKAHRRHMYQLLANEMGIAHWKVTLFYSGLQLMIALSVVFVKNIGLPVLISTLCFYVIVFGIVYRVVFQYCKKMPDKKK